MESARPALPAEQIVLAGKAFADEIEEGTDPRGSFQVSVSHDPQFTGQIRHRIRQRADQVGLFVAEIAGQQREADAGLAAVNWLTRLLVR
jgi:hypothetical protein